MKLTDEKVAKALGYFVTTKGGVPSIRKRTADNKWDRGSSLRLPAFTTSLDAIVAEIEARGISYAFWWDKTGARASIDGGKNFYALKPEPPAKALAEGLLAYLKESNREAD